MLIDACDPMLCPIHDFRKAREADILSYGVLSAAHLHAANTSLQWLFFTGHVTNATQGWETFSATIVQLSW